MFSDGSYTAGTKPVRVKLAVPGTSLNTTSELGTNPPNVKLATAGDLCTPSKSSTA
jgi:hypothetical protein